MGWKAKTSKTGGWNAYSRAKRGKRSDIGPMHFRSAWEANYARFLTWMKERGLIQSWEYESHTFWFEKIRRGVRSYTPDFRVTRPDGTVYFVEVKGWMDAKSKTKIKRMRIYHPSVELIVVASKDYKALAKSVGPAIKGWET